MAKIRECLLEAYVGEHGAGKSELALSRALWLAKIGIDVAIADLDTVEPCYTLNSPLTIALQNVPHLTVLSNEGERVFPGEAGNVLAPRVRWALIQNENVILDIGYGVDGYKVLNLLEGYERRRDFIKLYLVQNFSRPFAGTLESAEGYLKSYEKLDGIINNTHTGDKTRLEEVRRGEEMCLELGKRTGLPVIATAVWRRVLDEMPSPVEPLSSPEEVQVRLETAIGEIEMAQEKIPEAIRSQFHAPVWLVTRLMPVGFWG